MKNAFPLSRRLAVRVPLFLLLLVGTVATGHAAGPAPVAYEEFSYPAGALAGQTGGTGWTGPWADDATSPGGGLVLAGSLDGPGGQLIGTGNRGALLSATAIKPLAYRHLASSLGATGSTVWISFLLRPDALSEGWLMMGGPPESAGQGLLVGYKSTTIGMDDDGIGGSKWVTGITPALGVTMFLVVRLDFVAGRDTATLYVNPTPGLAAPDSIYTVVKNDLDLGTFTQLALRGKQSAQQSFDELRVGSSYLAVAPSADPGISIQPVSQTVGVGQNVTFSVTASGTAPFRYQWFFNGTPLAAATNASLLLMNVAVGQAGSYFAAVTNALGGIGSGAATLTVLSNTVLVVTTTNDSGVGSLRQAILDATGFTGTKTIVFNITSPPVNGYHTITPLSALPALTNGTVIDGYTQPGAFTNALAGGNNAILKIRLSGASAAGASGLRISNPGCAVYGLAIGNFGADGIYLFSAGDAILQGNFIGLDPDGVTVRTNTGTGIRSTATGAVIGGPLPWQRNVISGNLGGGISFQNSGGHVVQGNYFGTDASGTQARGNSGFAVQLTNPTSTGNIIGGELPGEGNVIAATTGTGSNGHGIYLVNVSNNRVQGNFIGTDATGLNPLGNLGYGIYLTNATINNLIGGTNYNARNVIAYNARAGVHIASGTNGVLGNSIFENGGLGIDLGAIGVQTNDFTDADIGPNNLQNYPVLSAATNQGGVLEITGYLRSRTSYSYRLEFFTSPLADTSTNGEGRNFLGATNISLTTTSLANFTFSFPFSAGSDPVVTATATDPANNTSEFSSWRTITYTDLVLAGQPLSQSVLVGASATFSITVRGADPIAYQWYWNGTPIAGANGATLALNEVTVAQAGLYHVVASNSYGTVVSQLASLDVDWALPPSGLVHWWAGDSNALDYIGTNHGTLVNGATYRAGKAGPAFAFNGTNDAVDVVSMPWLGTTTGVTVMAWIHRTNVVNRFGGILGRWQATGTSNSAAATSNTFLLACGEGTVSNRVKLLLQSTNLNSYSVVGGTSLPTNQWVHVAATWNSADGAAAVYLNGVRDGTTNLPAGQRLQFLPGYTTKIGTWGNSTNSENQFRGGIDEVQVLGRAISSNEVQTVYASGGAGLVKAPIITQQPDSHAVLAGSNITLNVAAVGVLPLAYQWNFNGTPLPEATNAFLTLNNAQAGDTGNYDVLVSNPAGSTRSQTAEVRVVLDAPVITRQPTNTTVSEGDTAMFSVTAVGPAPLTYQWAREGSALLGETNSTLTLTNAALADAGRFVVTVSNPSGPTQSQEAVLTVLPVPPTITTQPASLTVSEGANVNFTVAATSSVALFYQWARNGAYLPGATNASLELTNVALSASGNYTVIVSNTAGSVTSQSAVLQVQAVPPAITTQPGNQTVNEGTNVTFTVVATGTAPLSYQWVWGTTNLTGATNVSLSFSSVAVSASGNYTVIVGNAAGSVTSQVAVLTVLAVPPTITSQPVSRTVNEGANVSFSVTATGTAPLSYQWAWNTTNLPGATSATLSLANVALSVSGNYTVIVSNSVGSVTSVVAVLTVQPIAPAILSQPASRTVIEGTNVSFAVVATGTAPLAYQWMRNGLDIIDATNATLDLANLALSAGGNYTVLVSNFVGSATSQIAVLTVLPAPPVITLQPVAVTVREGTNANFTVAAASSVPLFYQWMRNTTGLAGATNASLDLTNVALSASGSYRVIVSNAGGSVTSLVAVLTVLAVAPAITTQPTTQTVDDGTSVTFTVAATGTAPLSFRWARNGSALSGATSATLNLGSVGLSDSGNYTVVVTNVAGSVTSQVAVLTVLPVLPTITKQPLSATVTDGDTYEFKTTATGTAPITYQWTRNAAVLAGATRYNLRLSSVVLSDSGDYRVIFSNPAGSVTSVVAVLTVVARPPTITTQPGSRTVKEGTNTTFTVAATGTAPLSYQWSRNAIALAGATNATLSLTNVPLSAAGNYTVVITNSGGSATSTVAVLTVQALPPMITSQPVSRTVNERTNVSFTVVATGTAPLSYQWTHNAAAIAAATNATLALTNVGLGDSGNYIVFVSNAAGSVTSQVAMLTVLALPPAITTQPLSQTVAIGSTITLSVGAIGLAPLRYQWQRSGVSLAGRTGSTLAITNVQPADAGTYRVVVENDHGFVTSAEAVLTVVLAPLVMTDNLSPVVISSNAFGAGYSSNTLATAEAGEPLHDGKPGGKSMWFTWRAPAGGIATFSTAGSGFDTLLAVYQGAAVNALVPVVSDDDEASYFNSMVLFNTESNQVYKIAVDGAGGVSGKIVLQWSLQSTSDRLPVITNQPIDQIVAPGSNFTFTVGVSGTGVTYQWYHHRTPIAGATNNVLTIANAGLADVGAYWADVSFGARTVQTKRGRLQLNLNPQFDQDVQVSDKFRDMVASGRPLRLDRPPGSRTLAARFAPAAASRGYTGTQVFSTVGSLKEPGEPNHCGLVGGASHWLSYVAEFDGVLELSTEGSSFDTVLAVYTGSGADFASLTSVACDNNSGSNGLTSRLHFITASGTTYFIVVDGVDGASGTVELNYTTQGDLHAPRVTITSAPRANTRLTNGSFNIGGITVDNDVVTGVEWRLTNGRGATAWAPAAGTAAWAFTAYGWMAGLNTVEVRASDSWGNVSPVVARRYLMLAPLDIEVEGCGRVSRGFLGTSFRQAGSRVTVTATPCQNYLFAGWTGGETSDRARISFLMPTGLVLQAHFVTNPFIALRGSYSGLFYETNVVSQESAGFVTARTTGQGTYSGRLRIGARSYSFSGRLGLDGLATNSVRRGGTNLPLGLELNLNLGQAANGLTGRVIDETWTAELSAPRAVFNARTNPAPYRGGYTLLLPANPRPGTPEGHGYGAVTVSAGGAARFSGSLADGTPLTQGAAVSREGWWPVYAPLHRGNGSVLCWLSFVTNTVLLGSNSIQTDLEGNWRWLKPGMPAERYYPAGFTNLLSATGSRYLPPVGRTSGALTFSNGVVSFSGGSLAEPFTNTVFRAPNDRVTNQASNQLGLTIVRGNGLFRGSVTLPGTKTSMPFKGAIFQNGDLGAGYSLLTNASGPVWFGPRE